MATTPTDTERHTVTVQNFELEAEFWGLCRETSGPLAEAIRTLEAMAVVSTTTEATKRAMLKARIDADLASTQDVVRYYVLQD